MSQTKPSYSFHPLPSRRNPFFAVRLTEVDGSVKELGTVRDIFIRHMNRRGWEATGLDGHRGVHDERWQAALALAWDRNQMYVMPYPFAQSRRAEVESV